MPTTMPNTMAFMLAGGQGKRLRPLTADRCKPAVRFDGRYRLGDFVLSNQCDRQRFHVSAASVVVVTRGHFARAAA